MYAAEAIQQARRALALKQANEALAGPKAPSRATQARQTDTPQQTAKTSPTSYVLPQMLVDALRGASVDRRR